MTTTATFTRCCSALLFATCTLVAEAADNPPIAFDYDLTVAVGSFSGLPLLGHDPDIALGNAPHDGPILFTYGLSEIPAGVTPLTGSIQLQSCLFMGNCSISVEESLLGGEHNVGFQIQSTANGSEVTAEGTILLRVVAELPDEFLPSSMQVQTLAEAALSLRPPISGTRSRSNAVYQIIQSPSNGTITNDQLPVSSNGPINYQPNPGFSGQDQFTYTVTDGTSTSATATITIDVLQNGTAPVARQALETGPFLTTEQPTITVIGSNFVANDTTVQFRTSLFGALSPAANVRVIDSTRLEVDALERSPGPSRIVVSTTAGASTVATPIEFLDPGLLAAVLPASRSVQVGVDATAFALMLNSGTQDLQGCGLADASGLPTDFAFQTTDPDTNVITGVENARIDISAGGFQTFVFRLTPQMAFAPAEAALTITCDRGARADSRIGINTLLISAANEPVPDVIAIAATETGTLRLDGQTGTEFFAVATANVGATGEITVEVDTADANLPLSVMLCIDAQDCLNGNSAEAERSYPAGSTAAFLFLITASGEVPFLPGDNRLFVRFKDADGIVRGATSIAVTTDES